MVSMAYILVPVMLGVVVMLLCCVTLILVIRGRHAGREKEKAAKGQKTKAPKNKTVTKNKKIKVAEKPTVTRVVKEAKEKKTIDASKPTKVVEKPKVI